LRYIGVFGADARKMSCFVFLKNFLRFSQPPSFSLEKQKNLNIRREKLWKSMLKTSIFPQSPVENFLKTPKRPVAPDLVPPFIS